MVYSIISKKKLEKLAQSIPKSDSETKKDVTGTTAQSGVVVPIIYGYFNICGNIIDWEDLGGDGSTIPWYVEGVDTYSPKYFKVLFVLFTGGKLAGNMRLDLDKTPWLAINTENAFVDMKIIDVDSNPDTYLDLFNEGNILLYNAFQPEKIGFNDGTGHPFSHEECSSDTLRYPGITTFWVARMPAFSGDKMLDVKFYGRCKTSTTLPNSWIDGAGVNPIAFLYDFMTNSQFGLGISSARINVSSFERASSYFFNNRPDYGLSIVIDQQADGRSTIQKIEDLINCKLYIDDNNLFCIKYFDSSETAVATLTDSDCDFTFEREGWDKIYTQFDADYTTINSLGYLGGVQTLSVTNSSTSQLIGQNRSAKYDMKWFTKPDAVYYRLNELMKQGSYPKIIAKIETDQKYSDLKWGDKIIISSQSNSVEGNYRVTSININEIDNNKISIEATQIVE